jgi:hypothetical protein
MITSTPTTIRELHSRVNDGIEVRLLWKAVDDCLFVTVADRKRDEEFCVEVRDRSRALDVFHHPYAYAAHHGVHARAMGADKRVSAPVSA